LVKVQVKAVKVGNSIRVAIPTGILLDSGIKEGDTLTMEFDEDTQSVVIERQEPNP
jgi:bifunctional DNA-binding transcriptional regulator/antitoxin component of YhaV-PrlF toxin-antitoxin module